MKNPDTVLRELGQLYDFNKKIAQFRIRKTKKHPDSEKKASSNKPEKTAQDEPTPRTRF